MTFLVALTVMADNEDFTGKIFSVGSDATALETGKWYFLFNRSTGRYVYEADGNKLALSSTSPNGIEAASNLGYLVQLESAGEDGKYYLKSAYGNYYRNVTTSKNNGTESTTRSTSIYTIAQFASTEGHWSLRSNGLYYLCDNSGTLMGASSKGSENGDRDWSLREASLSNISDLSGDTYIKYVLDKGGLVRLTNRRLADRNLGISGGVAQGAQASDTILSQVWILGKSGSGYTLRNGSTGDYLNSDDNFRTPSSTAVTVYIQSSPNNTASSSYINLSTDDSFSGEVCLNLNGDGSTLYKWTSQGDYGSDWSISLVDNYSLEEVEAGLLVNSKYKTPVPGKYYRLQNQNYQTYMYEGISNHGIGCESLNADKLSQYWTLVSTGSGYALQNLCSERYIARQSGATSRQYTSQTTATNAEFSLQRTDDETNYTYYIIDKNSIGLHCDANSNVVGWNTAGISASAWGFEEVELTEEFIQQGRDALNRYNDLVNNIDTYKTALGNLFADNACTTLKDDINLLSDEQLEANADYAALTDDMKAMVKKVKNDTWEVYSRSDGYSRDFEKFFRVRDDYKVYSNYSKMSWNEYTGMSNAYGKLSGPTGIVGKSGDIIYLYVDEEPSDDCTLQVEIVKDSESPGDHQTGKTTDLHAGLNAVVLDEASTVYIFYQLDDPEKYLANYPDMKIHIEGGELQGYFDLTRGMTNDDYRLLKEKLLDKNNIINMKGDRIVFAMRNDLVQSAVAAGGNEIEGLVRVWSRYIQNMEDLMGFQEDLKGRFRNIWNAFSVDHGYMYATTYGTYYSDGTLSTVLNYNTITTSGGSIWGPVHEMGHNHQACINIVGATEVSNNFFANANVYLLGISTTRGTAVHDTFNSFANGTGWFDMSIWEQTRMYFQLYLYYHVQGNNPNFYPTLFKLLRKDPISKRSGEYDASLVNGDGETVGGYKSYGRQDYLHMAKKMCDAAGEDLSEFFEVNGMFVPYDNRYIGDYGDYWVTTTEKDIEEAKAYMHKYPKAGNICFIDDRVKPDSVLQNSVLEGRPSGAFRVDYEDEPTRKIGYSDVGQYTDFVPGYTTTGYYYTTTTSKGVTTYRISGEGAVGFKVYDSDGNLVYLSNKTSFSIPDNVASKLGDNFRIVAAEGNGYDVLVPYGPAMYRGEMTAYYAGDTVPHTLYYYGTGDADESRISDLPANSVAYVKPGQNAKKQPTASLLAQANVVAADSTAQTFAVDGDKQLYIPTAFSAAQLTFTKSGDAYQALNLPFNVTEGFEGVVTDKALDTSVKTAEAGMPVIVNGKISFAESNAAVNAGTFASADEGYVLNAEGTAVEAATASVSPFTYIWNEAFTIDVTAINKVLVDDKKGENTVYDLTGRRVYSISQPGIYIVNGKKVLVK